MVKYIYKVVVLMVLSAGHCFSLEAACRTIVMKQEK